MRLAVKVAYDGSPFHGSQRQGRDDPGSVEGALSGALREISGNEESEGMDLRFSSRTDSGVSALGNVFSLETGMDPDDLLRAVNANLRGIWCWGWGVPRPGQNIRWASRWYRYHLPPGYVDKEEANGLNEVLSIFVGKHDFSNLCRAKDERNPVTFIEKAHSRDLSGSGELVVIDIVGSRFLWNQVRRMVGAALAVVEGRIDRDDILTLLGEGEGNPEPIKGKIRTVDPTGLVLMDVDFKDIDFKLSDGALDLALRNNSGEAWKASIKVLLHTAMRSFRGDRKK